MKITFTTRDEELAKDPEIKAWLDQCAKRLAEESGVDFEQTLFDTLIYGRHVFHVEVK